MKKALVLVLTLAVSPLNLLGQDSWVPIQYVSGTISSKDGDVVSFLFGSNWRVQDPYLILPFGEVTIVLETDRECGTLVSGMTRTRACHLSGAFTLSSGSLTQVVSEYDDGAVLEMLDASFWEVPSYDRYNTGWWLPPYEVIITADELYMINLDDQGKRVWVTRARQR